VVAQGVLGGFRVVLDERVLALVHGCTGPVFFAAAAAMVAVTSRRWVYSPAILAGSSCDVVTNEGATFGLRPRMGRLYTQANPRLLRLAILTAILSYLQLVIGAVVRHSPLMLSQSAAAIFRVAVYFHVLMAIAVTVHVLILGHKCYWRRVCRGTAIALAALIVVQWLLGLSTWVVKYGVPAWATQLIGETGHFNRESDLASAAVAAGHGAVGSLIVALCVVAALKVARHSGLPSPARREAGVPIAGVIA